MFLLLLKYILLVGYGVFSGKARDVGLSTKEMKTFPGYEAMQGGFSCQLLNGQNTPPQRTPPEKESLIKGL